MENLIKELKTLFVAKQFIVTGSVALKKYGLWGNSKTGDLDIILISPEEETIKLIQRLAKDFPASKKISPSPSFVGSFLKNEIRIEVFKSDTTREFMTIDGVDYSTILDIVKVKRKYNRVKDWLQLRQIGRLFFKEEDFEKFLNNN